MLIVFTVLLSSLPAVAANRYLVTLMDRGNGAASVAKRLAAAYHGQLETAVEDDGTFVIVLSAATAGLLARDPQVAQVRPAAAPAAGVAPDAATTWALGTYEYDDAGNIRKIGAAIYVYDSESRLRYEKSGTQTRQALTYDGFGNIRSITEGSSSYTIGASSASNQAEIPSSAANHLSGTYDGAGNLLTAGTNTYTWDALNVMTRSTTDTSRAYVYNANDERIGSIILTGPAGAEAGSQWTIRDPAGQVLRRFSKEGGQWRWMQDYIYRDGKMLASETNDQLQTLHYHLDHLGTPRLITGNGGVEVARHTYYPFGEEGPGVTPQVAEPKRFTGHERDGGGLDYMHARYYSPSWGRFLTVDPAMDLASASANPQRWNRYAYVSNNPLNKVDPDGREENLVGGGTVVNHSSQPVYIAFDTKLGTRNSDHVLPLQPGESSARFTFDADAVVIGPGQNISGATNGAFKVSAGSVEIRDSADGQLVLAGSPVYFAMKHRSNPEERSGHQPASQTPSQWQLMPQTPAQAEKERQETQATLQARREQKKSERWERIRDRLRFWD